MREKEITRTFEFTPVVVTVYNKDTKEMELVNLTAIDVPLNGIEKWAKKQFDGYNVVVIEYEIKPSYHSKYAMSIEDFIKYGKEV